MKYLWIKTVNGDEYRLDADEELFDDKTIETIFNNFDRINHLAMKNPTIFTEDGTLEELEGTVYLNPTHIVHAYLK